MLKTLKKDCKLRINFCKQEIFLRLVHLLNNSYFYSKPLCQQQKTLQKKYCFANKINSFCVISGRRRGLISKFKVSRIILKQFVASGVFFMLKKL